MKVAIAVTTALILSVVASVTGQSCYADIANPNFYFATKTSYKFIKNTNTDFITLPGTSPKYIYY